MVILLSSTVLFSLLLFLQPFYSITFDCLVSFDFRFLFSPYGVVLRSTRYGFLGPFVVLKKERLLGWRATHTCVLVIEDQTYSVQIWEFKDKRAQMFRFQESNRIVIDRRFERQSSTGLRTLLIKWDSFFGFRNMVGYFWRVVEQEEEK